MSTTTHSDQDTRATARGTTNPIHEISAHATVVRGLPGPALVGASAVHIVATVSDSSGAPVEALPVLAFDIHGIPLRVPAPAMQSARRTVSDFREAAPGVYSFAVESPQGTAHALLVTVTGERRGQARTILRVDA